MAQAAAQARDRGVRVDGGVQLPPRARPGPGPPLIADGRIGQLRHVRAAYLQDWLADAAAPLTWRLQREQRAAIRFVMLTCSTSGSRIARAAARATRAAGGRTAASWPSSGPGGLLPILPGGQATRMATPILCCPG